MRVAAATVVTAGLALLASACGGSPGSHVAQLGSTTTATQGSPAATTSAQSAQLAFARCMRSHGVPSFPDPDPQGAFPPFNTGISKQTSIAANDACKHLRPSGGNAGTLQNRQEKFAFALKVARCLRAHGFPNFPDPSQGTTGLDFSRAGIDPSSLRFQAVETACEKQARKALGLP